MEQDRSLKALLLSIAKVLASRYRPAIQKLGTDYTFSEQELREVDRWFAQWPQRYPTPSSVNLCTDEDVSDEEDFDEDDADGDATAVDAAAGNKGAGVNTWDIDRNARLTFAWERCDYQYRIKCTADDVIVELAYCSEAFEPSNPTGVRDVHVPRDPLSSFRSLAVRWFREHSDKTIGSMCSEHNKHRIRNEVVNEDNVAHPRKRLKLLTVTAEPMSAVALLEGTTEKTGEPATEVCQIPLRTQCKERQMKLFLWMLDTSGHGMMPYEVYRSLLAEWETIEEYALATYQLGGVGVPEWLE